MLGLMDRLYLLISGQIRIVKKPPQIQQVFVVVGSFAVVSGCFSSNFMSKNFTLAIS